MANSSNINDNNSTEGAHSKHRRIFVASEKLAIGGNAVGVANKIVKAVASEASATAATELSLWIDGLDEGDRYKLQGLADSTLDKKLAGCNIETPLSEDKENAVLGSYAKLRLSDLDSGSQRGHNWAITIGAALLSIIGTLLVIYVTG